MSSAVKALVSIRPRLAILLAGEALGYPLLFATISGAHLYGFPSPDSDFDHRGVHLLPLRNVVGMTDAEETVEKSGIHDGMEIDLVTHDAKKFFGLERINVSRTVYGQGTGK